jgi:transcriptional regulator with XRE-family HTH domain
MAEIQRIKKVIDWLIFEGKVKSRRDLAEKMGYTESSMSQILNEKVSLSDKFIKKLSIMDNSINPTWLLSGEGNMLISESIISEISDYKEKYYALLEENRALYKEKDKLNNKIILTLERSDYLYEKIISLNEELGAAKKELVSRVLDVRDALIKTGS